MSDAMTVVGEAENPTAKLVIRGLVVSAVLLEHEGGTRLRVGISGTRGAVWTTFSWDRAPDDHDHSELAREIARSIEIVLREASASLADLDPRDTAARAFLWSLAYLAIAAWEPGCPVPQAESVGFHPARSTRRRMARD